MNQINFIDFAAEPEPEALSGNESETSADTGSELVVLKTLVPAQVFADGGLDPIIEAIKARVKSEVFDVSTEKGRERIGSVARQIGIAKKDLERMALGLTEGWRLQTKKVNDEKARMVREMDALRDEIREPLERYRQIEADRVAAHKAGLAALEAFLEWDSDGCSSTGIAEALAQSEKFYQSRDWQEFKGNAEYQHLKNREALSAALERRQRFEQEQAEQERLRREQAEREQAEREAKIAAEAAEKARQEAEAKAAAERDEQARIVKAREEMAEAQRQRLEAEKAQAEARAAQAEADRIAAAERAEAERKAAAEAAAQKVKDEIEAKAKAEAEEAARREADVAHKRKINNEIAEDLQKVIDAGVLGDDPVKDIVRALAKGEVRHVSIKY